MVPCAPPAKRHCPAVTSSPLAYPHDAEESVLAESSTRIVRRQSLWLRLSAALAIVLAVAAFGGLAEQPRWRRGSGVTQLPEFLVDGSMAYLVVLSENFAVSVHA